MPVKGIHQGEECGLAAEEWLIMGRSSTDLLHVELVVHNTWIW
jgi:hypothetical protein